MSYFLDKICEDINIESACEHLLKKKDSCEPDGMYLSELPSYLIHNKVLLIKNIKMGNFRFSLAEKRKILSKTGGNREITILCSVDRLLLRMTAFL